MTFSTINHKTFAQLAEDGVIRECVAVADGTVWTLRVEYGRVEKYVASTNSRKVRTWSKLDTLHRYLINSGVRRWRVDSHAFSDRKSGY